MKIPISEFQKLTDCGITDRRSKCNFHISVFLYGANINILIALFEPVNDKNVLNQKNSMKIYQLIAVFCFVLFFFSCSHDKLSFPIVNSVSFSEEQVVVEKQIVQKVLNDSLNTQSYSGVLSGKSDEMLSLINGFNKSPSDSIWNSLMLDWDEFSQKVNDLNDSLSPVTSLQKWAELNVQLLKISGEAKFADVLDRLFYNESSPVITEKLLKSFAYTRVDDKIFINFIGSSSLLHHHTMGGDIKLTQETAYPMNDEILLKCESDDTRFLEVFVRIPSWSVNPTVNLGNVKYVAHPGEYCDISRKWKNGDEILIRLKN